MKRLLGFLFMAILAGTFFAAEASALSLGTINESSVAIYQGMTVPPPDVVAAINLLVAQGVLTSVQGEALYDFGNLGEADGCYYNWAWVALRLLWKLAEKAAVVYAIGEAAHAVLDWASQQSTYYCPPPGYYPGLGPGLGGGDCWQ